MLIFDPSHQRSIINDIIMKPNPYKMKCWSMELKKKIQTKNLKLKIAIKRMKVKIEIKNKLNGNNKFSFWYLNWIEEKH